MVSQYRIVSCIVALYRCCVLCFTSCASKARDFSHADTDARPKNINNSSEQKIK